MTDQSQEELKHQELLIENRRTYGTHIGEVDAESGQGVKLDDREIDSFFNKNKTAIIFQIFNQGHQTAGFTLTTKAAFFLMRLIDERLAELDKPKDEA